jgi:hypothetical protein
VSGAVRCECGRGAHPDLHVWNGRDYLPVCADCYGGIEAIATEACVRFAERWDDASLEECTRVELGFRDGTPWTPAIQAEVDRRYLEWYLEDADH